MMLTGEKGFLLSNILKDPRFKPFDGIMQFGSPIDSFHPLKLLSALRQTKKFSTMNKKIIFASSEAVDHDFSLYSFIKKRQESIITRTPYYQIFRIPRVYNKSRTKGLMHLIRTDQINPKDLNKVIKYITLQDFLDWFFRYFNTDVKLVRYNKPYHEATLAELIAIYR